jgi:hypothetical protein
MNSKNSFYMFDGSGRDTYIGVNSGGLKKCDKPLKICQSSGSIFKPQIMNFNPKTPKLKDYKIVHQGIKYPGDGSGRDSYVITNGGGTLKNPKFRSQFLKDYAENKITFEKTKDLNRSSSVFGLLGQSGSKGGVGVGKARTSVAHLNEIGRPLVRNGVGEIDRSMKIRDRYQARFRSANEEGSCLVLPALNIAKKNVRGFKNFFSNGNGSNVEFITSKHGSHPFINFNSIC